MTKKDLFILMIKLFGLYWIIQVLLYVLPQNISFAMNKINDISLVGFMLLPVLIILVLFTFILFNADKIVRILKLDKGFDDDKIEFGNLNASSIIKAGIFIIGGLLLLENIPYLIKFFLIVFQKTSAHKETGTHEKFNLVVSVINVILGYLLMTNYDIIANKFGITDKTEK